MNRALSKLSWLVLLLLPLHATAADPDKAGTAFETLKSLAGKWTIESEGKTLSTEMTYDTGSNGSIVTERFGKELSVFHRDGADLLMTHYCNVGNQPRLRLEESDLPGLLEFEMFDITNLKEPDASHVQKVIYKMADSNKFELELVWKDKKGNSSEKYVLHRTALSPSPSGVSR